MTRFVGIDEAGYGPNLGPLVMAAVIAESSDDREPDLWNDLAVTVSRAGGPADRVWVDDSKAILSGGKGRERLNEAAMLTLAAAGHPIPTTYARWLEAVSAGSLDDCELTPWLDSPESDPPVPSFAATERLVKSSPQSPLACDAWRIVAVRAVVIGPSRFNADLDATQSKAAAHFRAFARLLSPIWAESSTPTRVRSDKHGGRHFYLGPLADAIPDAWIDRHEEGPALSRYVLRESSRNRKLELSFLPRADAGDGLVALASITAKALRETWMDAFNAHWSARIPGLKPTAGYPVDAARFRVAIESHCRERGLKPSSWWRER